MTNGQTYLKAAEQLKVEGNSFFAKGKYGAAVEKYTEAITLVGTLPVLYVNRAMAHRRKDDWAAVMQDACTALRLDKDNMKANYLYGLAHLHGMQYEPAIKHLGKALEVAREANDSIKDDIWRELARAKYAQWQRESIERKAKSEQLQVELQALQESIRVWHWNWQQSSEPPGNWELKVAAGTGQCQETQKTWDWLFQRSGQLDVPAEVPSVFTCPLTMETFRDPAITKYGQSYERSVLLQHLKKSKWDPITRQPMTEQDVFPNLGLRQAVQHYLDEHPWAWRECMTDLTPL